MLSLAVYQNTGEIFVGTTSYLQLSESPGVLLPVKIYVGQHKRLEGPSSEHFAGVLIFQEINFEPTSGIRRGYLLKGDNSQGQHLTLLRGQVAIKSQADLFHYYGLQAACETQTLPTDVTLTFGDKERFSVGELVHIERLVDRRELLTIRMRRQFGLLPDLIETEIPEHCHRAIRAATDKVTEGYRASPAESVIDRCREAMAAILSCRLGIFGKDLKHLIPAYDRELQQKRDSISDLAHVVARLHARGKFAEQSGKGLPPISEREAELSVNAVGVVLVSLGWATWR